MRMTHPVPLPNVMKVVVLLCISLSSTQQFCFPEEDLVECLTRQNKNKLSTTREPVKGRF